MELSSSKLQRLVKCKAEKSLDSRCKRCNSEFSVVSFVGCEVYCSSSARSSMYCVQCSVQHALFSVQYSVHCFQFSIKCTVFSIQYLVHFTAPGALCVALGDEAISGDASGLDALQFILILIQSSHPSSSSLSFSSVSSLLQAEMSNCQKQ